jgi:O-acetyl-ADP-ribose deacetylase
VRLLVVVGDLAREPVDAVVRPVIDRHARLSGRPDPDLLHAAGPAAQAAFAELTSLNEPGSWTAGRATSTTGGDLAARWLIHVVVPEFSLRRPEHLLSAAYRGVLEVADGLGVRTLAMAPIGMTHPYWPLDVATRVATGTLTNTVTKVREVHLVVRTPAARDAIAEAVARESPA